jgi:hypothetical protein
LSRPSQHPDTKSKNSCLSIRMQGSLFRTNKGCWIGHCGSCRAWEGVLEDWAGGSHWGTLSSDSCGLGWGTGWSRGWCNRFITGDSFKVGGLRSKWSGLSCKCKHLPRSDRSAKGWGSSAGR